MIKEGTEVVISFLLFLAITTYGGFAVGKYIGEANSLPIQPGSANTINNSIGTNVPTPDSGASIFTLTAVGQHNKAADCWLVISNKIYSVSTFLNTHPGGASAITPYCGKDATQAFVTQGGTGQHSSGVQADLAQLYLGPVGGSVSSSVSAPVVPVSTPRNDDEEDDD